MSKHWLLPSVSDTPLDKLLDQPLDIDNIGSDLSVVYTIQLETVFKGETHGMKQNDVIEIVTPSAKKCTTSHLVESEKYILSGESYTHYKGKSTRGFCLFGWFLSIVLDQKGSIFLR